MASQYTIYILHTIGKEKEEEKKKINKLSKGGYLHVSASAKLGGLIVSFQ